MESKVWIWTYKEKRSVEKKASQEYQIRGETIEQIMATKFYKHIKNCKFVHGESV